jgi:hypothetical protein
MLLRRAKQQRDADRELALRWARLSAELDPEHTEARELAGELVATDDKPRASAVPQSSARPDKTPRVAPKKTAKSPKVDPEPAPPPAEPAPPKPAAADAGAGQPGGRWL